MKNLKTGLEKLLYRPNGMLFWAIGLVVQGIYLLLMVNKQTNGSIPICDHPFSKFVYFLLLSWVYAVAIGGSYQFGFNLNKGLNKRGESKGSIRPVYFNIFVSGVFIFGYWITYYTECTT